MVIETEPLIYPAVTFISRGFIVMGLNDHMTAQNLCRCASERWFSAPMTRRPNRFFRTNYSKNRIKNDLLILLRHHVVPGMLNALKDFK